MIPSLTILNEILKNHQKRYPLWQKEDIYKLLHQAAMGSGHAVIDAEHARKWLDAELTQLEDICHEPILEPISPDGMILRVHLSPFVHANFSPDLLLDAFINTAREYQGSQDQLLAYCDSAVELFDSSLSAETDPLRVFLGEMHKKGFPAVHHSQKYQENYHPAYRVVSSKFLPASLK